jgi:hypothetical protein
VAVELSARVVVRWRPREVDRTVLTQLGLEVDGTVVAGPGRPGGDRAEDDKDREQGREEDERPSPDSGL